MQQLVLSPLTFSLLSALLVLTWGRSSRALRWTASIALGLSLAAMCPFGANALVRIIESRVPEQPACAAPTPDTIVVLSAGLQRRPENADDASALEADSIERALAGSALWRQTPSATLIFAGGGPFTVSESAVLQQFAEHAGVAESAIRVETRSQTTWESAQELRSVVPALPKRIWLVSSAIHLPRALIAFHAAGFQPCILASDRRYLPPEGIGYFVPQSSALIESEEALHELAGGLVYRWRAGARSDG
ncbi:MAG TPA: YdcF family protein [Rudaea sp.]